MRSPDFARQSPQEERAERIAFTKRAAHARIALMDSPEDQKKAATLVQHFEEIALNGASVTIIAAISHSEEGPSKRLLRATITYGRHGEKPPAYDATIPYDLDQEVPIVPFFEGLMPGVEPNSAMSDARKSLLTPDAAGAVLHINQGDLTACEYYDPQGTMWTSIKVV